MFLLRLNDFVHAEYKLENQGHNTEYPINWRIRDTIQNIQTTKEVLVIPYTCSFSSIGVIEAFPSTGGSSVCMSGFVLVALFRFIPFSVFFFYFCPFLF